jgi:hypothetical protein
MKGAKLNSFKIIVAIFIIGIAGGCDTSQQKASAPGKVKLTVDFQQNQTLKYKSLSSRTVSLDWGQMQGKNAGQTKVDKSTESLELIVSYTPVEVNPYGLTTIKAVCESAKVTRVGQSPRQMSKPDAAESFSGKSWTFTVDSRGKMDDRSQLLGVIRQAGKEAFRTDRSQGLVKEPDMLYDFIATQWFLWDAISSINKPAAGVSVGSQWKSRLFVPAPMILFAARDVNYKLDEIQKSDKGQFAVIGSSYSLFYPSPSEWPVPYTDPFQMSGTYGFLRGYKTHDLQGQGQVLFNIDAGRIEKDTQKYAVNVEASLPMGLGITPHITIDQTITTDLLAPPK